MLGNPKFNKGDKVSFSINNKIISGEIVIIDKYGTFEDDSDVSYDIYSDKHNILYKHINENYIIHGEEN